MSLIPLSEEGVTQKYETPTTSADTEEECNDRYPLLAKIQHCIQKGGKYLNNTGFEMLAPYTILSLQYMYRYLNSVLKRNLMQ